MLHLLHDLQSHQRESRTAINLIFGQGVGEATAKNNNNTGLDICGVRLEMTPAVKPGSKL